MDQDEIDRRQRRFNGLVLLILVLFFGRLVWFQVIAAPEINAESLKARLVERNIEAVRGNIVDTEGHILATTSFSWDVNIDPVNVGPVILTINEQKVSFTKEQIAEKITGILRIPTESILSKMTGEGRYANLKKSVSASSYTTLKNLEIPWLYFDRKQSRHYADGAVAGNLIGFVGSDGSALAGI